MTSHQDIDGGWAWVVLFASYMNLMMLSGISYTGGVFQSVFLEEFDKSVALTSWVTAIFSSLMLLAGPLSSIISTTISCRAAVMGGGILISLGLFVSSFATSLIFLLITFGVVTGWIVDMTGFYGNSMYIAGGIMCLAAVIVLWIPQLIVTRQTTNETFETDYTAIKKDDKFFSLDRGTLLIEGTAIQTDL